jgi:hypothetical protein
MMACCGLQVAPQELVYEQQVAYARFGIEVLNPTWKFQEALPSQFAVKEMSRNLEWIRAAGEEWLARHAKWSADLVAGEEQIASKLAPILGCGIILVHEAI